MKRKYSLTYRPHTTYFLTATVTDFTHLFHREALAQIVLDNLDFYVRRFAIRLHGFVIMPNHIHLLLTTGEKGNVSQLMGRLKEYSAKQVIKWCEEHNEKTLLETFHCSAKKYKQYYKYQVWQERFDGLVITATETYNNKLEYAHNNPLQERWQLCDRPEDYRFSSARHYMKGEDVGVPIVGLEGGHP